LPEALLVPTKVMKVSGWHTWGTALLSTCDEAALVVTVLMATFSGA
jgi:hypothetical protein